jgi:hypothetical protein
MLFKSIAFISNIRGPLFGLPAGPLFGLPAGPLFGLYLF